MQIELSKIRTDGGTQSRANLQRNIINEYAELMKNDITMPPIDVFYDGENYWLADGFHRYWAKKQICANAEDSFLPKETIKVEVLQGTQRDAILFSLGANNDHGLRRTNEDKKRAVETMLRDNEWQNWSDREIAKICKVSNTFVSKCRQEINSPTVNVDSKKSYKRDGKVQTMKTENIGKHKITKEKEIVNTETGEIIIRSEKSLVVQAELEKCPNNKEMFESNQFKEAVKQEVEKTNPELVERFDQDVELPSYNVISEELFLKKEFIKGQAEKIAELEKLLDLSDKFYKQAEYSESKTKEKLAQLEKEIGESNQTIDALTETNNQLFLANENLNKELNEIKQNNVGLNKWMTEQFNEKDQKISSLTETNNQLFLANENLNKELSEIKSALGLENEPIEEIEKEITLLRDYSTKFMSINAAIEKTSLRLGFSENQNKSEYFFQSYRNLWKENVDNAIKIRNLENEIKEANNLKDEQITGLENEIKELRNDLNKNNLEIITIHQERYKLDTQVNKLTEENETLKEVNGKLKLVVKPSNSNQSDEMLASIQRTFEISLEKGVKKGEGIRIGRKDSTELLNNIKQTLGVE